MLKEFYPLRQEPGPNKRRWFEDEDMDLIVWYDKEGAIHGFQLCYDKSGEEHALTWKKDEGVFHNRVDDGDRRPGRKMSPVLVTDGLFPAQRVEERFREQSTGIDDAVRDQVLGVLSSLLE